MILRIMTIYRSYGFKNQTETLNLGIIFKTIASFLIIASYFLITAMICYSPFGGWWKPLAPDVQRIQQMKIAEARELSRDYEEAGKACNHGAALVQRSFLSWLIMHGPGHLTNGPRTGPGRDHPQKE
jgi:hypothetical protein